MALHLKVSWAGLQNIRGRTPRNAFWKTDIRPSIHRLKFKHLRLQLHSQWVPGHAKIEGNELADERAWDHLYRRQLSKTGPPATAAKTLASEHHSHQGTTPLIRPPALAKAWSMSPRYEKLSRIDPRGGPTRTFKCSERGLAAAPYGTWRPQCVF